MAKRQNFSTDMTLPPIETLLHWSSPREVPTQAGPRILRKAKPNPLFWKLWALDRYALKAANLSLTKDLTTGKPQVCWWQPLDDLDLEQRKVNLELSRKGTTQFNPPAPPGLEYFAFQRAGVEFAKDKAGCLIADDCGLGKTIQAIGVINCCSEIHRALVITKASLKENWRRELEKWLVRPMPVGIAEAQRWPKESVVVCNYDVLLNHHNALRERPWDLVILDECQAIKNRKTKRAIAVIGFKPSLKAQKLGAKVIKPIPGLKRLALSGTPIENRPEEIWSTLYYLDPQRWGSFYSFAQTYCNAYRTNFGFNTKGAKDLDKLQELLRSTIMIRRLKKDVMKELPAKTRMIVDVDPKGLENFIKAEQKTFVLYETDLAEAQAAMELAKADEDDARYHTAIVEMSNAKWKFAELAKVSHDTAVAKVPAVIELLKDELEDFRKILVFCCHHDVIDAVALQLNEHLHKIPPNPQTEEFNKSDLRAVDGDRSRRLEHRKVPMQVRSGSECPPKLLAEATVAGVQHMPPTASARSGGHDVREVAGDIERNQTGPSVQMPVRKSETCDSGLAGNWKIQRVSGMSPGAPRNEQDHRISDGGPVQTPSEAGAFTAQHNLERCDHSESVSTSGNSDQTGAQQIWGKQSLPGQNQSEAGLHSGKCLGNQLASQRDKAQRDNRGTGNAHFKSSEEDYRHVAVIDGRTPPERRQSICDRFQTDPCCRVFVGSIQACGEGLTLTAATLVCFVEEDWAPGKISQAEDRAHRIGQKDNVFVKHYIVPGTVDARMIKVNIAKQVMIDQALNDPTDAAPVFVPHEPLGRRNVILDEGLMMLSREVFAVHAGLRRLWPNGECPDKVDFGIGRKLAIKAFLTPGEAALGKRLCGRYRASLEEDLLKAMGWRVPMQEIPMDEDDVPM